MESSQSFYCGPFRRWFRFTAHTKVDSTFTVIWWFSYRAENSHFKIQKLEHYSLSLTPSPGNSRAPLCEWFFFSRPRWKDFYLNLYWNLHHSSSPISHTWKSCPANVLTFIIKNNFMCFAEENIEKWMFWNFRHIVSYLASTILWWKNMDFMCSGVCRLTPQTIVDPFG